MWAVIEFGTHVLFQVIPEPRCAQTRLPVYQLFASLCMYMPSSRPQWPNHTLHRKIRHLHWVYISLPHVQLQNTRNSSHIIYNTTRKKELSSTFFSPLCVFCSHALLVFDARGRASVVNHLVNHITLKKTSSRPSSWKEKKHKSLWLGRRWTHHTHFSSRAVVDWRRALFGCQQAAHFISARFPRVSRTTGKHQRNFSPLARPVAPARTLEHWSCSPAAPRERFSSFLEGLQQDISTGKLLVYCFPASVSKVGESWHDAQRQKSSRLRVDGAAEREA